MYYSKTDQYCNDLPPNSLEKKPKPMKGETIKKDTLDLPFVLESGSSKAGNPW